MADLMRHRRSLWLRSERALGVRSVRLPGGGGLLDEPVIAGQAVSAPQVRPLVGRNTEPAVEQPALIDDPVHIFDQPITDPPLGTEEKRVRLVQLEENEVRGCTKCRLSETRIQTVFGEGNTDADIMFVGEGPGEQEDQSGRPFVGRAGQKLDEMIGAMGIKRGDVYIANIVKCRPPRNREPAPDETATCTPYLVQQIELVRPRVIVTLGRPASQYLLRTKISMGKLRGEWQQWRGIPVMPTFHPAYILRNYTPEVRRAVWSDLQQVMRAVGLGGAAKTS